MTPDEARQCALGYAWGCEDTSGIPTVKPPDAIDGSLAFGAAYAQGQTDYNAQRRGNMIPVRDAYANWQNSDGRAVFKRGELTLTEPQQRLLRQAWDQEADPRKPEWRRMQETMQATLWAALTPAGV